MVTKIVIAILIIAAIALPVFALGTTSHASARPTSAHVSLTVLDSPVVMELLQPAVIRLPEVIVVARRQAPKHAKVMVCGAFHAMSQGPVDARVRDCEMK